MTSCQREETGRRRSFVKGMPVNTDTLPAALADKRRLPESTLDMVEFSMPHRRLNSLAVMRWPHVRHFWRASHLDNVSASMGTLYASPAGPSRSIAKKKLTRQTDLLLWGRRMQHRGRA